MSWRRGLAPVEFNRPSVAEQLAEMEAEWKRHQAEAPQRALEAARAADEEIEAKEAAKYAYAELALQVDQIQGADGYDVVTAQVERDHEAGRLSKRQSRELLRRLVVKGVAVGVLPAGTVAEHDAETKAIAAEVAAMVAPVEDPEPADAEDAADRAYDEAIAAGETEAEALRRSGLAANEFKAKELVGVRSIVPSRNKKGYPVRRYA